MSIHILQIKRSSDLRLPIPLTHLDDPLPLQSLLLILEIEYHARAHRDEQTR